jgi:hypothetical protein
MFSESLGTQRSSTQVQWAVHDAIRHADYARAGRVLIARGYCVDALRCLARAQPSAERDLLAFAIELTMHGPSQRSTNIAHEDSSSWHEVREFLRTEPTTRPCDSRGSHASDAHLEALHQSTCDHALNYIILAWNAVYTASLEHRPEALAIVGRCLNKTPRLKHCRAIVILHDVIRLVQRGNLRAIAFHREELNAIGHRRFATMLEVMLERCPSRTAQTPS